ncbi:MAG: hypothetical protein J6J44_00455 [Lachnospiraceae bacterium]|nr:hypothetical protein [Lachnospiraceae bacterium]
MTEWILTSSVLILLVLAVRGLFKNKMKAKAVYALWLIVLVRLLCPVNFGELSFNLLSLAEEGKAQVQEHLELQQAEKQQELQQESQQDTMVSEGVFTLPDNAIVYYSPVVEKQEQMHAEAPVVAPEIKTEAAANPDFIVETPAEEPFGFSFPEISWQKVLPYAWIIGMVCIAVVIFVVNISFSTTLGMFRKELPSLARKGRGKKALSVYLADGIMSSCLYGVVHPSIYLNKQGMNEQEKTYCVEHEYSHYLQGDMVWSLCRTVCLVLHWYNPLVWVAVMLSKKDAELACDERTIERLGEEERYSYGHTLVELAAKQSRAVQVFGMATLMASDKKEVVERVKAIAIKKQTKLITGLLVAALVVGIGFFVFTGEAKGEQDKNNKNAPVATETPMPTAEAKATVTPAPTAVAQITATPAPTVDPALEEYIKKSKEKHSRNELLTYILETNKFPVEGSVLATKLNVRKAAGYDADRIDILLAGTTVMINAVEQDAEGKYWYAISYEEKDSNWIGAEKDSKEIKNGYVNSAYLTEAGAVKATIEQITAATPTPMQTWIVPSEDFAIKTEFLKYVLEKNSFPLEGYVVDGDWIRSEPSLFPQNGSLGRILRGTKITVLGVEKDNWDRYWFKVAYNTENSSTRKEGIGYVGSDCITWNGTFRLYEQRNAESAYTEHLYYPHYIRSMRDSGDEKWFFVGTAEDEFGWVLYGENEGVDSKILKLCRTTEEEFAQNRAQRKLEIEQTINKNLTYRPLTFTDHVKLDNSNLTAWLIDLNGDGKEERLYISGVSVFIDEKIQLSYPARTSHSFWLLDIDSTDGIYELMDDGGSMFIYNGEELREVKGIQEVYTVVSETGTTKTLTRFCGNLDEFTRVDEHTISFTDHFFFEASFYVDAHYALDDKHNLQVIPQEYELVAEEKADHVSWYNYGANKDKPYKLYKNRDLSGDYTEAKELTNVTIKKTDCVEWVYIEAEGGYSGWLHFSDEPEYFFSFVVE